MAGSWTRWWLLAGVALAAADGVAAASGITAAEKAASAWARGIRRVNEAHARDPGSAKEGDLGARVPEEARAALETLLSIEGSDTNLCDSLVHAGNAAMDLDLAEEFGRIRARLEKAAPARLADLGTALSRPRFVLRGYGGLDEAYLRRFATVLDGVLDGYDATFGFREWSKVPGKKFRVRLHLEERIAAPPRFAPQFPFHSEIDFPVVDRVALRSPTERGEFLLYGLCHELGHLVAMWGAADDEEDFHTWAHYTGSVVVDHLSRLDPAPEWMGSLKDGRRRSMEALRKEVEGAAPSLDTREGVLALLVAIHDLAGPRAVGAALNLMDGRGDATRVNRVRYYALAGLRAALMESLPDGKSRIALADIWSP